MLNVEKLKNKEGKIWLNPASSIYVLDNFVNFDNHILIRFIGFYVLAKFIMPKKYHELLTSYYEASKKAPLIKHDCRKNIPFPGNSVDHILSSHFLEHVFPEDCERILNNYKDLLKTGGTLHIILPDFGKLIRLYNEAKAINVPDAADILVKDSLLSKYSIGSFKYRLLEFGGGFGLQHRWMYDYASIHNIVINMANDEKNPSNFFRKDDDSVHIVCRK
jgi:hypothetical protein